MRQFNTKKVVLKHLLYWRFLCGPDACPGVGAIVPFIRIRIKFIVSGQFHRIQYNNFFIVSKFKRLIFFQNIVSKFSELLFFRKYCIQTFGADIFSKILYPNFRGWFFSKILYLNFRGWYFFENIVYQFNFGGWYFFEYI